MENPNTSKHWNEEFEIEWNILKESDWAYGETGYRWDSLKFGILGAHILLRGRFLDIGCGLGHFCRFMKARNSELETYGIDFSPKAIELAEKIDPKIDFRVADAMKIPFPDNFFDVVSALEIIEHLENPDEAIKEWKRVLKPKKKLFITTPWRGIRQHAIGDALVSCEHLQEWTPDEFHQFLKGHFGKKVKIILPPALTDIMTKDTELLYWFVAICEK